MMQNEFVPLFYGFHFYLFGLIALASAILFVTRKSPVAAALWLVQTMFALAALYIMMDAQFVGVMQILVYAGAIMVVFLFVIMLLNLGHPDEISDIRGTWGRVIAGLFGIALLAEVGAASRNALVPALQLPQAPTDGAINGTAGVIGPIAGPMFKEYLLAFELTSVLLLVAVIGAVVLGKKSSNAR
ncbi:MAG: NADH-quinone oxidoreductase subunit J [Gemmatimonadetes bacterium]|jgi:NADH-quinone oxidoreductase subunit J|nr:NADH-quinone oxidoreductase subunit J [Gemmatimonadota bacterium]